MSTSADSALLLSVVAIGMAGMLAACTARSHDEPSQPPEPLDPHTLLNWKTLYPDAPTRGVVTPGGTFDIPVLPYFRIGHVGQHLSAGRMMVEMSISEPQTGSNDATLPSSHHVAWVQFNEPLRSQPEQTGSDSGAEVPLEVPGVGRVMTNLAHDDCRPENLSEKYWASTDPDTGLLPPGGFTTVEWFAGEIQVNLECFRTDYRRDTSKVRLSCNGKSESQDFGRLGFSATQIADGNCHAAIARIISVFHHVPKIVDSWK